MIDKENTELNKLRQEYTELREETKQLENKFKHESPINDKDLKIALNEFAEKFNLHTLNIKVNFLLWLNSAIVLGVGKILFDSYFAK